MPVITALYAGLLGLFSMVLSARSGLLRGKTGISIGDGGNTQQLLEMRRHGNFIEYVPLALVLLAILEMRGVPGTAIHALGGALVVTRLAHAIGLKADNMAHPGRAIGAGGTALVILVSSIWAIVTFFQGAA